MSIRELDKMILYVYASAAVPERRKSSVYLQTGNAMPFVWVV